jgi:hypothetical protein
MTSEMGALFFVLLVLCIWQLLRDFAFPWERDLCRLEAPAVHNNNNNNQSL